MWLYIFNVVNIFQGLCSTSWTFMDGCAVALLINSESYCRLELSTEPVSAKLFVKEALTYVLIG